MATALVGLVLLSACTGARPRLADEPTVTSERADGGASTTTTAAPPQSKVAQALGDAIDVFPDATSDVAAQRITGADATSAPNIPLVFLVKSEGDDRLEVHLPVGPNGSTGWVRRDDVTLASVNHRIEVRLAEHRIRVLDGNEVVVDEPIGVGTTDRPTPGGVHYLKELLQPPDPTGPYGTYAYVLSGSSTELTSFNEGQGVIGIHGTNDPASIGQDVSSGCIGLDNAVIDRLVNEIGLPLGTPVEILA